MLSARLREQPTAPKIRVANLLGELVGGGCGGCGGGGVGGGCTDGGFGVGAGGVVLMLIVLCAGDSIAVGDIVGAGVVFYYCFGFFRYVVGVATDVTVVVVPAVTVPATNLFPPSESP